jgi:hypothetical protein
MLGGGRLLSLKHQRLSEEGGLLEEEEAPRKPLTAKTVIPAMIAWLHVKASYLRVSTLKAPSFCWEEDEAGRSKVRKIGRMNRG